MAGLLLLLSLPLRRLPLPLGLMLLPLLPLLPVLPLPLLPLPLLPLPLLPLPLLAVPDAALRGREEGKVLGGDVGGVGSVGGGANRPSSIARMESVSPAAAAAARTSTFAANALERRDCASASSALPRRDSTCEQPHGMMMRVSCGRAATDRAAVVGHGVEAWVWTRAGDGRPRGRQRAGARRART